MRPRPLNPVQAALRRTTARPGDAPPPAIYRPRPAAPVAAPTRDPAARDAKTARLEAALFLADEPLTLEKLAEAAGLRDAAEAKSHLDTLRELLDRTECAFQIEELAGGHQLLTRPAYHGWLLRLRRTGHDLRLTPTALETLAVIAYKQPVTRADVEKVRGTAANETVRVLMEKGLVRAAGRDKSLGRPQLYATTKKFLQSYGLNTLNDLPRIESLRPAK